MSKQLTEEHKKLVAQRMGGNANSDRTRLSAESQRRETTPLSSAQEGIWLHEQLIPGTVAYHIPIVLKLTGTLKSDALRIALQQVVNRHEILRSTFHSSDQGPYQKASDPKPLDFELVSYPPRELADEQLDWLQWIGDELSSPLDLEAGQPIKVRLLVLEPTEHILLLQVHHLVFDGWSAKLLLHELSTIYNSLASGEEPKLPPLPFQYADFAVRQLDNLNHKSLSNSLAFWRSFLDGAPEVLELHTDTPRSGTRELSGSTRAFQVPHRLLSKARALYRKLEVTPFVFFLSIFVALLHRHTMEEDLVIGTPIAGRDALATEELIGCFVNMLPIRARVTGAMRWDSLLQNVKSAALQAIEHREVPFETILRELKPNRSMNYHPVFQVLFIHEEEHDLLPLSDIAVAEVEVPSTTSKFDITFSLIEGPNSAKASFTYSTELFTDDRIKDLEGHFLTILEAIIDDPQCMVQALPLLTENERTRILTEWNTSESEFQHKSLIHECFQRQVSRSPDRIAVTYGHSSLTYRELNELSNQYAFYLEQVCHDSGPLVGVLLDRRPEMVAVILAVLKAGKGYIPLDPSYPASRLTYMLQDANPGVLVTYGSSVQGLKATSGIDIRLIDLEAVSNEVSAQPTHNLSTQTTPHSLAYVLYTSGSTGLPKGVAIEHRSVVALAHWAEKTYTQYDFAGVLASTSLCFDLSVFELLVTLMCGGTVLLVRDALQLTYDQPQGITLLNTVPSVLTELVEADAVPITVRTVNVAGEPLPPRLIHQLFQSTPVRNVYNLYGPTEATTYSTAYLMTAGEGLPSGKPLIGRPIHNTKVYILDPYMNPVPCGVPGEVFIGGCGLARGYLNDPWLTNHKFVPNPFASNASEAKLYATGDRALYHQDGNIEFLGRLDNQVKIRGYRIELDELDRILSSHPNIQDAVSVAWTEEDGTKRLVSYVVAARGRSAEAELRKYLEQTLPPFMHPSQIQYLHKLPLSPNGKLARHLLPAPKRGGLQPASTGIPQDAVERQIATVWAQVLGLDQVNTLDNFFQLGGDSLLAVRVTTLLSRQGLHIDLLTFFKHQTISSLARTLRQDHADRVYRHSNNAM